MHKYKEVEQTYVHLHMLTRKNIQWINDIIKVKKIPKKERKTGSYENGALKKPAKYMSSISKLVKLN